MHQVTKLLDVVNGTTSNTEGLKLYYYILNATNNSKIILSFEKSTPISSSFFNSSFGAIIDQYGYEFLKNNVKMINLNRFQKEILDNFFKYYLSQRLV